MSLGFKLLALNLLSSISKVDMFLFVVLNLKMPSVPHDHLSVCAKMLYNTPSYFLLKNLESCVRFWLDIGITEKPVEENFADLKYILQLPLYKSISTNEPVYERCR